jgi:hypothetical protein
MYPNAEASNSSGQVSVCTTLVGRFGLGFGREKSQPAINFCNLNSEKTLVSYNCRSSRGTAVQTIYQKALVLKDWTHTKKPGERVSIKIWTSLLVAITRSRFCFSHCLLVRPKAETTMCMPIKEIE